MKSLNGKSSERGRRDQKVASRKSCDFKSLGYSDRLQYVGLLHALVHDASAHVPGVKGLERDLLSLEARYEHEGDGFLTIALPTLGKSLDLGISNGWFTCPTGFEKIHRGTIPKLFQGLFCVVFDAKTGEYIGDRGPKPVYQVSVLRQLLYFFKKLSDDTDRAEMLDRKAKEDFVKCDHQIGTLAPFRSDHIKRVSNFVLRTLDEFQELDCRHGPGAVMEGYKANQKWKAFYSYLSDLDTRLISSGYDVVSYLHRDREKLFELHNNLPSDCARLVTVPKTSMARRTITVEPLLNQFVQQGLNVHLRNEISRCSVMSRCLSLTTQVPNQKLALEGSLTGEWVTVDLSSASDRLSTTLVETVFANRPRYLSAMLGCRTPLVEVDNLPLLLKKYAGMGNATTFPVQSVTFALIALSSMIKIGSKLSIKKLEALASDVHVFGDDIVIRRRHYPAFAEWIESCGLKINRSKTFTGRDFRESCGVDAYAGHTVTPVYLRSNPHTTSTDTNAFVGVLSTCNQLWLQGFWHTSDYLKRHLDRVRTLPLMPQNSSGLGYNTFRDVRTYQRWSSTLHRFEVRTYVPAPVREPDRLEGMPALMKFFHSPRSAEFDPNHLVSSVRRFNLNLRKRWVPSV